MPLHRVYVPTTNISNIQFPPVKNPIIYRNCFKAKNKTKDAYTIHFRHPIQIWKKTI